MTKRKWVELGKLLVLKTVLSIEGNEDIEFEPDSSS